MWILLVMLLAVPSSAWAAVGIGQHTAKSCLASSCTTTAISTTTGSTFVVYLTIDNVSVCTFVSLTDSPGNTYTQIGTELPLTGGGSPTLRAYYVKAGTGSASHTVTLASSASCLNSMWVVELTGTNVTLDQQDRAIDATSPYSSPLLATNVPNELLLGFISEGSISGTCTHTHGNSFTQIDAITDCNTQWAGATSSRSVSDNGSYQTSVTITGSFGDVGNWLTTWYEAIPVSGCRLMQNGTDKRLMQTGGTDGRILQGGGSCGITGGGATVVPVNMLMGVGL